MWSTIPKHGYPYLQLQNQIGAFHSATKPIADTANDLMKQVRSEATEPRPNTWGITLAAKTQMSYTPSHAKSVVCNM